MRALLDRPRRTQGAGGVAAFESRAALGLLAVVVGALPFLVLMLLVRATWAPLQRLDDAVAQELNGLANRSPGLVDVLEVVTHLGGNAVAVYVFVLATLWFALRGQRRLAWYVATTGLGLAVLVPVTKVLIGRARPVVPFPVAEVPTNASFPSGHSMVAIVLAGLLALLLMPSAGRWRPLLLPAALLVAALVGFTRLALGVHFLSDVLAGWALGAAWLAVTTAAFTAWQRDHGVDAHPLREGVTPARHLAADSAAAAAADRTRILPEGRVTLVRLGAAAAPILIVLIGLGFVVTDLGAGSPVTRADRALLRLLVEARTPSLTDVMRVLSALAGTTAVVAVSVAAVVLATAVTGRRRPAGFMAITVLGELLLYFVVSRVVGRARPDVPDLTSGLPVAASWPSGHAAAAVAVYGGVAALVIVLGRSPLRWTVLALPVFVSPLVAVGRVYVAAHRPSDVLAGLVLGSVWLWVCVRLLLADQRSRPVEPEPGAMAEHPGPPERGLGSKAVLVAREHERQER